MEKQNQQKANCQTGDWATDKLQ